jgi:hypothetical protein
MSFIKIERIDPNIINNPDAGHIYLGQDSIGLWEKDEYGNITYILSGNTYITINNFTGITYNITGSTSSGTSGTSGFGTSGTSGKSGISGTFGTSGSSGDGTSGSSATSGTSAIGSSGSSGNTGTSGSSGVDGSFYGSSGTSGYSGGYGGATRVWKFTTTIPNLPCQLIPITPQLPPMGTFWAGNDSYVGNLNLALVNKLVINTTDLDGQSLDNWLNMWVTGLLKIEEKNNASIFGIYNFESVSNTKPFITVNLISGFTCLAGNGNLINNTDYFISFVFGSTVTNNDRLTEINLSGLQNNNNYFYTLSSGLTTTLNMFYLNGQLQTYGDDYIISTTTLIVLRPPPSPSDVLKLYGYVN